MALWDEYWQDRGQPWEHDPGPDPGGHWAQLFAATPEYRRLSKQTLGRERFRWHFGPMFFRGRLRDGDARVLVIGQEGAQDESLAHRSFVGGTGARLQHLLRFVGVTRSYLFLNTFVYPITGEYDKTLRPLAQNKTSPIVQHRHELLEQAASTNDLALVIAVGLAARDTVATWKRMRGGQLPAGTRLVHVVHPGAATAGGADDVRRSFAKAAADVLRWAGQDPGWLPPDPDGHRGSGTYALGSAPVPFRDLPFGMAWRLGRGGTSSNRRDSQRSIQMFSAGGRYNDNTVGYAGDAPGSRDGYDDEPGDLAWEPPKAHPDGFDRGPSGIARLLQGGEPGLPWPDFAALGLPAHPSFGHGAAFRGVAEARVVVLADQHGHDDLFTGRALCGDAGQRLHRLLALAGVGDRYAVIRPLPVDSLGASAAKRRAATTDTKTVALVSAVLDRPAGLDAVVTLGPLAEDLAPQVVPTGTPVVSLTSPGGAGWKPNWNAGLAALAGHLGHQPGGGDPTARAEIPRTHLPYGTVRWWASSGDRAVRGTLGGKATTDYYKYLMPAWAAALAP